MTHEQKIESLSNEIRKALPYLMELSEGCLIEETFTSTTYSVTCFRTMINNEVLSVWGIDVNNKFMIRNFILKNYHKIIGKQPMLNDVLKWLEKNEQSEICLLSVYGKFYDYDNDNIVLPLNIYWNLEKPYLKDQSIELVDFLYSLIEK